MVDESDRIEVADLIAFRRAKRIECAVCGQTDCAVLFKRSTRGRAVFERLRCEATGDKFRRVWTDGYR